MGDKEVLKTTTEIKIRELQRQEDTLSTHYATIERNLATTTLDASPGTSNEALAVKRLRTMYNGINGLYVLRDELHQGQDSTLDLLTLGEIDPASINAILNQRVNVIEKEILQRRALWRHNKLLGELLVECLDTNGQPESAPPSEDWELEMEIDEPSKEDVPSLELEREQAQKRLEHYFFKSCSKKSKRVLEYLETKVFQRRDGQSDAEWQHICDVLGEVREAVSSFSYRLQFKALTCRDIVALANALLVDKDQLSPSVVKLLESALHNATTQQELVHVLKIKLSNLEEFAWPHGNKGGVPVVIKRAINGRYRSLVQEDAISFLLFQYIGLQWSIFLKPQLVRLLQAVDVAQRTPHQAGSVHEQRKKMRDGLMLSALPDAMNAVDNYGDFDTDSTMKKPMGKQDILRLICTEAHLLHNLDDDDAPGNGGRGRSMVAVVTDIEFFGPSVSHEVVLGIMSFLGVGYTMRGVFKNHMKMPLRFPGTTKPRVMAKGVPAGRKSGRLYSELLLFVMDYAVMARSGVFLYRTHDDICYFTLNDDAAAVAAWDEIQVVAKTFGLRLNMDKSGSVRVRPPSSTPSAATAPAASANSYGPAPLPQQPIRWGLLELHRDATVRIDADKAEWFARELAQKLGKTRSVLRFVTVYNKYMRFFLSNFGDVSPVFGLLHVDKMIEQVHQIHATVFPETNGNVVEAMRVKIDVNQPWFRSGSPGSSNASIPALPAGWLYWPLDLGGLGLFHPLLELWSLKQAIVAERRSRQPFAAESVRLRAFYRTFTDCVDEQGLQRALKTTLDAPRDIRRLVKSSDPSKDVEDGDRKEWAIDSSYSMRSLQEFLDSAVEYDYPYLVDEYATLLKPTDVSKHPKYYAATKAGKVLVEQLAASNTKYWNWVAYVYTEELNHVFESTRFVPRELLPAQLIDEIKKGGIYWS